MRARNLLLLPLFVVLAATPARAGSAPVLHEQIAPDPHEDLALQVALDGDLPVALDTKSGMVSAPDPRRPPSPGDQPYDKQTAGDRNDATFTPDRNTKRPDIQGYDEPFTPSTAPFKRLEAFDAVSETYELYVRDKRLASVPLNSTPSADGSEEQFYADLVIDAAPGRRVRIPSVGPGSRIVRARLGLGAQDMALKVWRDGAENWFAEATSGGGRARLVMELTIPRSAFGGEFFDTAYSDLPRVAPLPDRVARSAKEAAAAIGVSRDLRPRENVNRLVTWFRSFVDSEDPPRGRGDIYLDLALSKKGVCRHRAFAFLITAQSLGIPTRMVINEAHAWVEVHDGVAWRRIDLGGAGRMVNPASNAVPERPVYQPPPDNFAWPQGSERGDDMVENARARARQMSQQPGGANGDGGSASTAPSAIPTGSGDPLGPGRTDGGATPPPSPTGSGASSTPGGDKDDRPTSTISIVPIDTEAHRGAPLHVRGEVKADGETCAHVVVELYLRDAKDPKRQFLLGTVATGDKGEYTGAIVVPGATPLGDYDIVAKTRGDARCGSGGTP